MMNCAQAPDLRRLGEDLFVAARFGDVRTLERLRCQMVPEVICAYTARASGHPQPFSRLLEESMFVAVAISQCKNRQQIAQTDLASRMILEAALEHGDAGILDRRLFNESERPMDRAIGLIYPQTTAFLLDQGIDVTELPRDQLGPHGAGLDDLPVGALVTKEDYGPQLHEDANSLRRLIASHQAREHALSIIQRISVEIQGTTANLRP